MCGRGGALSADAIAAFGGKGILPVLPLLLQLRQGKLSRHGRRSRANGLTTNVLAFTSYPEGSFYPEVHQKTLSGHRVLS